MSRLRELRKEAQVALPTSGESYKADDGTVSTVLDDTYDPSYEPTEEEIKNYAEWLGMQLPEEEELMWLAREGLRAPVPKEWKPCKTDTGEVYYFNFKTGESLWDHPMDGYFQEKFAKEREKLKEKKANEAKNKERDEKERKAREREDREQREREREEREQRDRERERQRRRDEEEAAADAARKKRDRERKEREEREEQEARERREASAAAATKRNNLGGSSVSAASADSASPLAASSSGGPRLMTEADKRRQATIRKDMEAELQRRIRETESDFSDKLERAEAAHKREIESAKSAAALRLRQAQQQAEDDAQDELETKQQAAEAKSRREIKELEADVEEVRDEIKRLQRQQVERIANGESEIENSVAAEVRKKVANAETAILAERQQHTSALKTRESSQKLSAEADHDAAVAAAISAAKRDFAAAEAERRSAHDARIAQMRRDAAAAIDEEIARISRSKKGEAAQLVAELEARAATETQSIKAAGDAEVAAFETSEQAALEEMQRVFAAELRGAGGGAELSGDELARLQQQADREAETDLADSRERQAAEHQRKMQRLSAERAEKVAAAKSAAASGDDDAPQPSEFAAKLRSQHRHRIDAIHEEHSRELAEAKAKAQEDAKRAGLEATNRQAAEDDKAFDEWCEAQLRRHRSIEQENGAARAKLAAAGKEAQAALAAVDTIRAEASRDLAARTRELREQHENELHGLIASMADELTAEEHARRRAVEADIASPDASGVHARPQSPEVLYDDTVLLETKLRDLRADFIAKEAALRSQCAAASASHAGPPPLAASTSQGPTGGAGFDSTAGLASSGSNRGGIDARNPSVAATADYVSEQMRDADARHDARAAARGEFRDSIGSVPRHHEHRNGSRPGSAMSQTRNSDVGPELVAAISQLNERVESLFRAKGGDGGYSTLDVDSPPRRRKTTPRGRSDEPRARAHSARQRRTASNGQRQADSGNAGRRTARRTSSNPPLLASAGLAQPGDQGDSAKLLAQRWSRVLENAGHRGSAQ